MCVDKKTKAKVLLDLRRAKKRGKKVFRPM